MDLRRHRPSSVRMELCCRGSPTARRDCWSPTSIRTRQQDFLRCAAAQDEPRRVSAIHRSVMRMKLCFASATIAVATLLLFNASVCEAQANRGFDRVILGGTVMDPASGLNAVRNIGLRDGRITAITAASIKGRDTIDAHGLVV